MPDSQISFGHHNIPLLSPPGAAGGKAHLSAVKAACKSAERIHGALTMAGRFEIAILPDDPDFFDSAPGLNKPRNLAWETIRTTLRIQWVIPTRHPENIVSCLPQTWIGKGFQNVCIGYIADSEADFPEKVEALRKTPVRYRMIHLGPTGSSIDLNGQLDGIDWIVFAGKTDDTSCVAEIEAACRTASVALLIHQPGGDMKTGIANEGQGGKSPWPMHPFGTKIDLCQPTLPDLKGFSAPMPPSLVSPSCAKQNTGAYHAADPITHDLTPKNPVATAETPDEILQIEVLPPEPKIGTLEFTAPEAAPASPVIDKEADEKFRRLDQIVRRGLATFIEVGQALAEIRSGELWLAGGYASWAAYCQMVGGLSKTHANRLINSSEIAERLARVAPIGVTPISESQVRPLCKLKPEQQARVWRRATKRTKGQPTARQISEVIAELTPKEIPASKASMSRKAKMIDLLNRLRSAVRDNCSAELLESLISELEQCLSVSKKISP